jgi:hypothetical protein
MELVNLTPHSINFICEGKMLCIPPSGTICRCQAQRQIIATVQLDGVSIPVNRTVFGPVSDLPAPRPGVGYLVSSVVALSLPEREDLYMVDEAVRDEHGRIVGCKALAQP